MKKAFIAYFSCGGTTKALAQKLSELTGGELYEIKPAVPYTDADLDWTDSHARSTVEMQNSASRPALSGPLPNLADYDTVFVGFPIWWYVAPTIICSFLERVHLSGKTVVPFATSGSSGVGKTDSQLHAVCPSDVNWKAARRFSGRASKAELAAWIESLDL